MDQMKIGQFIAQNRKNQNLTQEQLAERLGISKNAVSKWERGLNLPDVSIMQELCRILDITLNELFAGEKIDDIKYKEVADKNLKEALENSSFSLKEKIAFFKKKWIKEHISSFVLSIVLYFVFIIVFRIRGVEIYFISFVSSIIWVLFYTIWHNNMMIYVENNVYKKIEK